MVYNGSKVALYIIMSMVRTARELLPCSSLNAKGDKMGWSERSGKLLICILSKDKAQDGREE